MAYKGVYRMYKHCEVHKIPRKSFVGLQVLSPWSLSPLYINFPPAVLYCITAAEQANNMLAIAHYN